MRDLESTPNKRTYEGCLISNPQELLTSI